MSTAVHRCSARCALRCGNNEDGCGFKQCMGGEMMCDGGIMVCGRDCP
jgi:hypothetical protein